MTTDVASWTEWKRVCALGGCGAGARAALQGFAHHRFHHFAARLAGGPWEDLVPGLRHQIDAADAWHLFESFLEIRSTRAGKRYKDWLFARLARAVGNPLGTLEAGATLIMRDVVREHVRREYHARRECSLNAPLSNADGQPLTLEILLPATDDPVADVARREYAALADTLAGETCQSLRPRTRVAILARLLGLSLADPVVEEAAGCRKSALNEELTRFHQALRARVEERFADDGPRGIADILCRTMLAIQERLLMAARANDDCAALLLCAEGAVAGTTMAAEGARPAAAMVCERP